MSIDPKFVELTAGVLKIFFFFYKITSTQRGYPTRAPKDTTSMIRQSNPTDIATAVGVGGGVPTSSTAVVLGPYGIE